MAMVLSALDLSGVTASDTTSSDAANDEAVTERRMNLLEMELQNLCLPFLRVAALLRHHMYVEELPAVQSASLEFVRLVFFLELVETSMEWKDFNATKALRFLPSVETALPMAWCAQLRRSQNTEMVYKELVPKQHVTWQQPRLLSLPREYEKLFTVSLTRLIYT